MVSGKSPDNFTVRSSSLFVDKLRAEKTRLRYDNEPAMRLLSEKIAAFRHPRTAILEPINRAEHQSVGGVERAHQSIQAATRALRLDIRARTGEDVVLGHTLFQWMLRHAAWSHNRFLGSQDEYVLQRSFELPFMEVCMIRVPIEYVLDESDGPVVLPGHWAMSAKTGRKPPSSARSCRENQESCSRSCVVSSRPFEFVACICAHQVILVRPTQINWQLNRTEHRGREEQGMRSCDRCVQSKTTTMWK